MEFDFVFFHLKLAKNMCLKTCQDFFEKMKTFLKKSLKSLEKLFDEF